MYIYIYTYVYIYVCTYQYFSYIFNLELLCVKRTEWNYLIKKKTFDVLNSLSKIRDLWQSNDSFDLMEFFLKKIVKVIKTKSVKRKSEMYWNKSVQIEVEYLQEVSNTF